LRAASEPPHRVPPAAGGALAHEAASSDLKVKIADLDADQATIIDWHKIRTQRDITPKMSVELFRKVADVIAAGASHDLLVIDGPAMASAGTD
jgi:chromosome partitioning protein